MVTVEKKDYSQTLLEGIKNATKYNVLVGIPEAETERDENDTGVTNAYLLRLHTEGSPAQNIPSRPVLQPAILAHKDELAEHLKEANRLFLAGETQQALQQLEILGLDTSNIAKDWFEDPRNGWEPNSLLTILRKQGSLTALNQTLVDTGQMRNAITYVVAED